VAATFHVTVFSAFDRLVCAKWIKNGTIRATAKPNEKKHFGIPPLVFGQVPWPVSSSPEPVAASRKIGDQASRNSDGFHRRLWSTEIRTAA
jgi:hypothetical protein